MSLLPAAAAVALSAMGRQGKPYSGQAVRCRYIVPLTLEVVPRG